MSLEPTAVEQLELHQSGSAAEWRPVCVFIGKVMAGMAAVGVSVVFSGFLSMFVKGLLAALPPRGQANVDALAPPVLAWLVTSGFLFIVPLASRPLATTNALVRRRAGLACVTLGAVFSLTLFYATSYAIPGANPARQGRSLTTREIAEWPPHVLTNGELAAVSRWVRGHGAHSPRLSMTRQVRVWCALSLLPFACFAAELTLRASRSGGALRLVLLQIGAYSALLVGCIVAIGPAVLLRPSGLPQEIAWALLALLLMWAGRRLMVALREIRAEACPAV